MDKKIAFLIYSWGTTFIFIFFIFWLTSVQFPAGEDSELYKIIYRLIIYYILFLLIFRSFLATFKSVVKGLSGWRSRREKNEDEQFVFIIETLLILLSIFIALTIGLIEEFLQINTAGRVPEVKDVLVSFLGIMLSAIVTYSFPILGELEIWLKEKFLK